MFRMNTWRLIRSRSRPFLKHSMKGAHELIGANFGVTSAFFNRIFSIATKKIQYHKKTHVSRFYTYRRIMC